MAFAQRILNFRFQLGRGNFGQAGFDTVELSNLRASVNVSKAGGVSNAEAEFRIWGMPADLANHLTVLSIFTFPESRNNIVTISAGDELSGVSAVFVGTIIEAWVDARNAPDVAFHCTAMSAQFDGLKPIPPTSYSGTVDAATALEGIAAQMSLGLENSGVTAQLDNPYWPGDLQSQLRKICDAANCEYDIDKANDVLAVWPKGGSRGNSSILISKDTGLVGYPEFTQQGCRFTTLYNPSIAFRKDIEVKSALAPANGTWTVANVNHELDSLVPNGRWFTQADCTYPSHVVPVADGVL